MILQLNPPLRLNTTKGEAIAHFLLDYGCEHNLIWICFLDSNGECWSFPNSEIRIESNYTMNRRYTK